MLEGCNFSLFSFELYKLSEIVDITAPVSPSMYILIQLHFILTIYGFTYSYTVFTV